MYRIAGHFYWGFIFVIFATESPKTTTVGYYDDVLRAYNKNKTMKIRFQGLITENLIQRKFPAIYGCVLPLGESFF